MRAAAALLILAPLLKKPYFTSKEAKDMGVHPAVLSHYVKTGHLKRVRRGVYQRAGYQNPSAFRWEDLVESVCSVKGGLCVLSLL